MLPALAWAVFAAVFQQYSIVLPNRLFFSFGSTFVLLASVDQGLPVGLIAVTGAALVTGLQAKRMVQRVFNFGQLVISLVTAFGVARGVAGSAALFSIMGWLSVLLGALTYFAVNTILVAIVVRLSSRRPFRDFLPDLLAESYVGSLAGAGLLIPLFLAFHNGGWLTLVVISLGIFAFRYAVQLYLEQKRIHLDTLEQLGSLVERKIGAAENHAIVVAWLARSVAEELKLKPDEVESIYAAGLLHDIGEAEIDPHVVSVMARKAVPTLQDLEVYRQHPTLGESTVSRVSGMGHVAKLVRHHHEAWDGSGYPDGLAGEAIPMGARILAAVEAVVEAGATLVDRQAALPRLSGTVIDPALEGPLGRALVAEAKVKRTSSPLAEAKATDLQRQLLQELHSSQLMEAVGAGRFLSYEAGSFYTFIGTPVTPPAAEDMARVAEQCLVSQLPRRERMLYQGRIYDVYALPINPDSVRLLLFDLTQALAVEREQTRQIFQAYRDVISVATAGKLTLLDEEGWKTEAVAGEPLWEVTLLQPSHGHEARNQAVETAARFGVESLEQFRLKVSVAEAVTNVFKHAGRGTISARLLPGTLRYIIRDEGDGIPYNILPEALLQEGYSTKRSMGKGFSMILRYADRLMLRTSREGTILIIDKRLA